MYHNIMLNKIIKSFKQVTIPEQVTIQEQV